ncbi:MAG TPA: hypothetical protein DC047_20285 [Blastocatellia bacterium]|nr:hypothetical protein [Blastocatellia bacterium]
MAKILIDGEWYEELSPAALYERDIEQIILQQANFIYPQYYLVPFKVLVHSEEGSAKADLALIHKGYREWWIVEVERGVHDLSGHVEPQVRKLSRATYGESEALALCKECDQLDSTQVFDMMKGKAPRVLVLVNTPKPTWIKPLEMHDCIVATFEIFRSQRNKHIFRVNGKHPSEPREIISICVVESLIPRFLRVESPAGLGVQAGEKINIRFNDFLTEWERVDAKNKVWLSPMKLNPLSSECNYELLRDSDGCLVLQALRN